MCHFKGTATPAAVFLKTANTEGDYGALPSAKLYTVICQIGRSVTGEQTTCNKCRHFSVSVEFFWTGNTPNIKLTK